MNTAADLDALYAESWRDPEQHIDETGATNAALATDYAALLAASLHQRDLSGLHILDFGAGRGEFAQALCARGATVSAVDPYGFRYLAKRGLTAYPDLRSIPPGEHFDGVTTLDVVEHLAEPWLVLAELASRLRCGGWLFVATPNVRSLLSRVCRSRWREAVKPGHIVFFTDRVLESVLRDTGFTDIKRLRWPVRYHTSAARNLVQVVLRGLRLDGELRLLASHHKS